MKQLKKLVVDWLGFSGKEVNGFLVLLPLMLFILLSEPLYRWIKPDKKSDFTKEKTMLDSLTAHWNDSLANQPAKFSKPLEHHSLVFAFDPNKASIADFESLGFPKNLSTRIVNYRQKGGVFRIKRDLLKMYGMDSTLYHQLYTWIQLPDDMANVDFRLAATTTKKRSSEERFDINKADTAQLKTLPGIGEKLASRIIKFRDGLGGFISPSQFSEIYGLDSGVVARLANACFIEKEFQPKRLNLNATDEKTLMAHPYISRAWAKAILAYRFQHGDFLDVRDVLKIQSIPPQQAERIIPYFKVKE